MLIESDEYLLGKQYWNHYFYDIDLGWVKLRAQDKAQSQRGGNYDYVRTVWLA